MKTPLLTRFESEAMTEQQQPEYLESAGRYIYGKPRVRAFLANGKVKIGSFVSISYNVTIFLGGNHRMDWVSTWPFAAYDDFPEVANLKGEEQYTNGNVVIGNDVWLCENCTIMSGVTIGDGAVVGANAVVRKDVAPYSVVLGNPAREFRKRFDPRQIESLLKIAWWDWPEERIRNALPVMCSKNIDEFIIQVEAGQL